MRDEEQYSEFVRARWYATARLAYAMTLDRGHAEDLAQEAMARLWFRWHRVRDGNPEAYLRKVLVSLFLTRRRRRWHGERPSTQEVVDVTPAPDEISRYDDVDALRRALATLGRQERAVAILRYVEDLPERDVAEILGCAVGTVKKTAHRARTRLREEWQRALAEPEAESEAESEAEVRPAALGGR